MNKPTDYPNSRKLNTLFSFSAIPNKTKVVLFSTLIPILSLVSMTYAHEFHSSKFGKQNALIVNGKVISSSRDKIGSVVSVKGTSTETVTDTFGNFTLDLSDVGLHEVTLEFNRIGFEEKEIKVNLKTVPKLLEIVTLERSN